ncbi:hypothetical protein BDV23DRAFT_167406 [Aspergillus alliaceus]|uniref:Uncharacterized protein n=1 Tax=Petromyces alliaceus TaxID=209559 RepID=A0A5N7BQX8_PETAA|nr:hypothetical protein BDV23DRAFT_167406 [Aspergillus alliaceus]
MRGEAEISRIPEREVDAIRPEPGTGGSFGSRQITVVGFHGFLWRSVVVHHF